MKTIILKNGSCISESVLYAVLKSLHSLQKDHLIFDEFHEKVINSEYEICKLEFIQHLQDIGLLQRDGDIDCDVRSIAQSVISIENGYYVVNECSILGDQGAISEIAYPLQ